MVRQVLFALFIGAVAAAEDPPAAPSITVGKPAPDFTVTGPDGKDFKLSDFRGKSHLVIVFGRAHW